MAIKRTRRIADDDDEDIKINAAQEATAAATSTRKPTGQSKRQATTATATTTATTTATATDVENDAKSIKAVAKEGIPRRLTEGAADADTDNSKKPIPSLLLSMVQPEVSISKVVPAPKRTNNNNNNSSNIYRRRDLPPIQGFLPPGLNMGDPWEQMLDLQPPSAAVTAVTAATVQQTPTIKALMEKKVMASLQTLCKEIPPLVVNTDLQSIDLSGSFLPPSTYDFLDTDNEGDIVLQARVPIFPEDFPPNQPPWPLAWWGIVDPKLCDRSIVDPKLFPNKPDYQNINSISYPAGGRGGRDGGRGGDDHRRREDTTRGHGDRGGDRNRGGPHPDDYYRRGPPPQQRGPGRM
jgi:hypothetical protein